ncbi:MAG: polymer-forming cytoskeletal protein [Pseudomonadota bacterium]|nr:polymer-forming cytoskeletal protein [Pseudomonadota bacterium]
MFEKALKNPKATNASKSAMRTKQGSAAKSASPASVAKTPPPAPAKPIREESTTIGASIKIKGELSGKEDLVIEGTVEGTIHLKENSISVSEKGKVQADVYARSIIVKGELSGDLYGTESVTIARSGKVSGNIIAPRVVLEDGAKFKGNVDMDSKPAKVSKPKEAVAAPVKASTA